MKKNVFTFLFLLFSSINSLTAQGIDFKHMTLEEALTQAKEQAKLIFIDFHTEWCGPCKKLAAGPFKEQINGDFYNKNFINLKLDAEKEGKNAAERYNVNSFPTLLFVNGEGEIVHQGVGLKNGSDMIGFGKDALNASNSKYSWVKLQGMFPKKQDDEVFLKLYIQKMEEFGADPSDGIEAWLKVQTEFKDSDSQMMQFLLDKQSELCFGTKAEAIFEANYEHYLTIATDRQKTNLERFRGAVFLNTLKKARNNENAELMLVVIDRLQRFNLRPRLGDDLNTYKMDYYRFLKDNRAFKRLAEHYVDSLISLKSVKEIRIKDEEFYQRFAKDKQVGKDRSTDVLLQKFKEGKIANDIVEAIVETAHNYFNLLETKKESKVLNHWVEYCYKLIPGKYSTDNLKADILFRDGKTQKAIALKNMAVEKMPFTVKKKVNYEYELEVMKQNQK